MQFKILNSLVFTSASEFFSSFATCIATVAITVDAAVRKSADAANGAKNQLGVKETGQSWRYLSEERS